MHARRPVPSANREIVRDKFAADDEAKEQQKERLERAKAVLNEVDPKAAFRH
jgi:hypothetical protein